MSSQNPKGWKGLGMEGWIARWYTRTRRKDLSDFKQQAHRVASRLSPGAEVLEVAPGPGFFSIELAKLGDYRMTGLDVSRTFIEIAQKHAQEEGVKVDFRHGSASAMPFPDDSFDFIFCMAAFKNFSEPVKALDEMHRVLRAGGAAVIGDLRRDASLADIDAYLDQSGREGFDAWMTKRTFRWLLLKRAYTEEGFRRMASESRFAGCQIAPNSIGLEVRLTKEVRQVSTV
jgi:ubiquinone/menaquinone biosynthesis C-methylase UbiE